MGFFPIRSMRPLWSCPFYLITHADSIVSRHRPLCSRNALDILLPQAFTPCWSLPGNTPYLSFTQLADPAPPLDLNSNFTSSGNSFLASSLPPVISSGIPAILFHSVLVSCCCCNKVPQTGLFRTAGIYSLLLEGRSWKSCYQRGHILSEGSRGKSVPCLSLCFQCCWQFLAFLGL